MNQTSPPLVSAGQSRRDFLKTSSALAAGVALGAGVARPGYAAENNTIKLALVGCGGRGTGAASQAMSTKGPTKLVAVADVFTHRTESSLKTLSPKHAAQMDVPPERRFIGLDAFKKAIDCLDKGDVVLLTTAPAFRPIHLDYAVQKGVNVFMEKSFAVDPAGTRRVLQAGELAGQKNLKIAGGLMSRHSKSMAECIQRIHDGMIGDIITVWAYRMHDSVGLGGKQPGQSDLAHQIANYSNFTWLNGSFYVDWLIHNVDVACWVKNEWPVSAQGMGGRQVRKEADQLFDHYAVENHFADGTRMFGQARHITKCYDFWGVVAHGTKGSALLGEGQPRPRIFKGHKQTSENMIWDYKGPASDAYQYEHDLFFDAIRNDKPYNETERCAKSCQTAILGRMACESGSMIAWDEALASNIELAPGLENLTWDGPAPAPLKNGKYEIAMPGETKVI
ncbi:MAG: Gfo/Idh/MocA family oxidoreductase [Verrucomicrobia bacterium]|nr:Gfo/Idh/MocA family oxidoreductase [Verrucomicrobiota bacterium]